MTHEELKQAAIDFLGGTFKGDHQAQARDRPDAHVVQAAVAIVLSPPTEPKKS